VFPGRFLGLPGEFTVFALLVAGIFVHESQWLRLRIYGEWLRLPSSYRGLLERSRREPPGPMWQRVLSRVSAIVNHAVVAGVLVAGAQYLWSARRVLVVEDPLVEASVVFTGILLAIIGAFNLVEVLDDKTGALPSAIARTLAAASLSGIAFGAAVALGLRRGTPAGLLAFSFGFGLPVGAWVCGTVMRRVDRGSFPARPGEGWQRQVLVPLIAVGRAVDALLRVMIGVLALPRTLLARVASWRDPSGGRRLPEEQRRSAADEFATFEEVGASGGFIRGYLHRPPPPTRKLTLTDRARGALLVSLLKGDGWLPRRLRREPIRLLRGGGAWEREDPLDFTGRVQRRIGSRPSLDDLDFLSRRLLALFLAAYTVAWVVEVAVGHVVAHAGRPLFGRGPLAALTFGLVAGVAFALVAALGRSTLEALAVGLVSGLALDPTVGLGEGLAVRLVHHGPALAIAFVLLLVTTTLGRRALGVVGALALAAGLYLQALPSLRLH
jgi:hypothetical protein